MTSLYFWQEKKEDENRKSWDESAEEYGGQRKPRQPGSVAGAGQGLADWFAPSTPLGGVRTQQEVAGDVPTN